MASALTTLVPGPSDMAVFNSTRTLVARAPSRSFNQRTPRRGATHIDDTP